MTEPHDLDATAQAAALRRRELSSVELVAHQLRRITDHAGLGTFVTVAAEEALAAAVAADRRLAEGADAPFLGVPTAVKDLTATAGTRTTMGSRLVRDQVPEIDAHVVSLLTEAGFVSLGKTNTPEFGLASFTDNDVVGETLTPWDPTRNAGGSSGGAAASVAARLVSVAQGSDGGGSIRIPASCCGVLGIKPSRGRVSPGPLGSDWSGLAVDGPISRTVRDAAALLDVLARPMPGDARGLPTPPIPFAEWARRDPGRLRVARWSRPYLPGVAVSPESLAALEHATGVLADLGHEVDEVENPFPARMEEQFNVVWSAGMAAAPIPDEALGMLRPTTRYWRERGGRSTGAELAAAMQYLEQASREVAVTLSGYDLWLTPTLALPPQPTSWFTGPDDPAETHRRELAFTPYTAVLNMAGVPAASVPLHWTEATNEHPALPIGVMLAAPAGQEGRLFSALGQLETTAPWDHRRPPRS